MDTPPPASNAPASNVPEYTVAEISGAVKRTLEGAFGRVRVRGEITEYKRYPSGHMYFSLKDEGGKISGVVWKGAVSRLGLVPENGVEVIATGKVSSYGDRSSYQLVVDRMDYAGAGALLARIEMLRARLADEGLFDDARKRRIPLLPGVVGVVTSAQGAVLQDIKTTVARRFPRNIVVWPVPVQGEGAAARIAAAIEGLNGIQGQWRPDVVIVARGGGSLEDLMAFNDEAVVRAARGSAIPLISAVGHETDTTLIDFASDRRAPTPTAAAEMAVPSRVELVATVGGEASRLGAGLNRMVGERRLRLSRAERGLPDLPGLVGSARQRLDDRAQRLQMALPNLLAARRAALNRADRLPDLPGMVRAARLAVDGRAQRLRLALPNLVAARRASLSRAGALPDPRSLLAQPRARLELAGSLLAGALRHATGQRRAAGSAVLGRLTAAPVLASLRAARARLDGAGGQLEAVSPLAVLARGYALVTDQSGQPVTSAKGAAAGTRLRLRFGDGDANVVSEGPG